MKKSDIYEFAIKILGLYLVIPILERLGEVLTYAIILIEFRNQQEQIGNYNHLLVFMVMLFNFILLTTFAFLLIFKTRGLTNLICKKDDYLETSKLLTNKKTIIEISTILIGLVVIILNVPGFVVRLKNFVCAAQNDFSSTTNNETFLLIEGVKIVIGIIAIYYAKPISSFLSREKETDEK